MRENIKSLRKEKVSYKEHMPWKKKILEERTTKSNSLIGIKDALTKRREYLCLQSFLFRVVMEEAKEKYSLPSFFEIIRLFDDILLSFPLLEDISILDFQPPEPLTICIASETITLQRVQINLDAQKRQLQAILLNQQKEKGEFESSAFRFNRLTKVLCSGDEEFEDLRRRISTPKEFSIRTPTGIKTVFVSEDQKALFTNSDLDGSEEIICQSSSLLSDGVGTIFSDFVTNGEDKIFACSEDGDLFLFGPESTPNRVHIKIGRNSPRFSSIAIDVRRKVVLCCDTNNCMIVFFDYNGGFLHSLFLCDPSSSSIFRLRRLIVEGDDLIVDTFDGKILLYSASRSLPLDDVAT